MFVFDQAKSSALQIVREWAEAEEHQDAFLKDPAADGSPFAPTKSNRQLRSKRERITKCIREVGTDLGMSAEDLASKIDEKRISKTDLETYANKRLKAGIASTTNTIEAFLNELLLIQEQRRRIQRRKSQEARVMKRKK